MPFISAGIKQYKHIIGAIDEGVITLTADGYIDIINKTAEALINATAKEMKGKPFTALPFCQQNNISLADFPFKKCTVLAEASSACTHLELKGELIVNQSKKPKKYMLLLKDISHAAKQYVLQPKTRQATKDQLTGTMNRQHFIDALRELLGTSSDRKKPHALIYIDLDQFKAVNDSAGYQVGDKILHDIAQLIHPCIRKNDIFGRLGGDEFGIVLVNCRPDPALKITKKIAKIISEHAFEIGVTSKHITASIGLLSIDQSYQAVSEVIRDAEIACNLAKKEGNNHIHQYVNTEKGVSSYMDKVDWLDRINTAFNDSLFTLYFQSFANFIGEEKIHGEVLVRLPDDNGQVINPGEFMPCVEHFHLSAKLDRYVVDQVYKFFDKYSGVIEATTMISINLSGQSINDPVFRRYLYAKVASAKRIFNNAICFEITENIALAHLEEVIPFIKTLKSMGVSFALDDFGNGASSFTYLRQLPVDFLKIDGQLINNINTEEFSQLTVDCLTKIAKLTGAKTIAEWVETKEVCMMVKALGVDYIQGYHYHQPEPMTVFFAKAMGAGFSPLHQNIINAQ